MSADGEVAALAASHAPFLIGVRHHSPALAVAVPRLLDGFGPDVLAVELPAQARAWVDWLAHPETVAPVALAFSRGEGMSFYPFADFSPELAALRWARGAGVEVACVDLPVGAGPGDGGAEAEAQPGGGLGPAGAEPGGGRPSPVGAHPSAARRPRGFLRGASRTGRHPRDSGFRERDGEFPATTAHDSPLQPQRHRPPHRPARKDSRPPLRWPLGYRSCGSSSPLLAEHATGA